MLCLSRSHAWTTKQISRLKVHGKDRRVTTISCHMNPLALEQQVLLVILKCDSISIESKEKIKGALVKCLSKVLWWSDLGAHIASVVRRLQTAIDDELMRIATNTEVGSLGTPEVTLVLCLWIFSPRRQKATLYVERPTQVDEAGMRHTVVHKMAS